MEAFQVMHPALSDSVTSSSAWLAIGNNSYLVIAVRFRVTSTISEPSHIQRVSVDERHSFAHHFAVSLFQNLLNIVLGLPNLIFAIRCHPKEKLFLCTFGLTSGPIDGLKCLIVLEISRKIFSEVGQK